jgi:N-acetylneuraminic acid mutarotase
VRAVIQLRIAPLPLHFLKARCAIVHGLQLQFLGGLKSETIHGIYTDEAEAKQEAEKLLK